MSGILKADIDNDFADHFVVAKKHVSESAFTTIGKAMCHELGIDPDTTLSIGVVLNAAYQTEVQLIVWIKEPLTELHLTSDNWEIEYNR